MMHETGTIFTNPKINESHLTYTRVLIITKYSGFNHHQITASVNHMITLKSLVSMRLNGK